MIERTLTNLDGTEADEDSCLALVEQEISAESGIVDVQLQPHARQLLISYDPQRADEDMVARVAERVSPVLRHRWDTCTMLLGQAGGRACESCALALERQLERQPGIRRATASFRGGAVAITYDQTLISPEQIAVRLMELGVPLAPSLPQISLGRWEWLTTRLELIFTIITLVGMLSGLAAEKFGWPLVMTVSYATAYATGGYFGLRAGLQSLRRLTIDVDLLMILAALGAAAVGEPFEGVMLLFLFSLSNVLQNYALDRTRSAISSLMQLRPDQALVRRGDALIMTPIERVRVGEHFLVKPGERIPLDGVIAVGQAHIDQASITGESMPVSKGPGEPVFAGTIAQNGHLEIETTKLAADSTLARMIRLVEEAHSEKAKTQRFIDTAEQYYATGVILVTALAIGVPLLLLGEAFGPAFYRAMTLMVAASPCALVISTPATVLSAIANGARRGVLFKGGIHVENAAGVKVVTFDKTGTLTIGKPVVTDVLTVEPRPAALAEEGAPEETLLALAAAVEMQSEHPLGQAIVQAATQRGLRLAKAHHFTSVTGMGVSALVSGRRIAIGNQRYFTAWGGLSKALETELGRWQDRGKTTVVVAEIVSEGSAESLSVLGLIAIADVLRPAVADIVRDIKAAGVTRVVMLTGDHERVARAIAAQAGVDEFYADLMPEEKAQLIKQLETTYGPVAMVGDGVNDALALATSTLGIAMGAAGTDVALESADLVLMSDDLHNIPYVIALSRRTRRTLIANLSFAMFMILLMIGAIFFYSLPLPLAVLGHEGGTVLVSLNGLRLLAFRPRHK